MAANSRTSAENAFIQARLDQQAARKALIGKFIPYLGLVFLIVFFTAVTNGKFVSSANLSNLIEQCFTMVIVACGAAFVYAQGNMDFSIGSACGVAQMVGGLLLVNLGVPLGIVLIVIMVVPVITCSLVSLISVVFKVPVFIGSMCIRALLAGVLTLGVQDSDIVIPISKYPFMMNNTIKTIVLVVVIALAVYLFHYTRIGKYARAIGGNPNTAQQAGVKVVSHKFLAYIFLGLAVGIASMFALFRSGQVSGQSGSGIEFNMMLAIVLGGFPMSGGQKASVPAAIVGAVSATLLTNGLGMWGLDPNLVGGIKGLIFLVMIGLSYDRSAGKLVN